MDGENGLIASGYQPGVDFETHNASDLASQISLLGTKYSGIVVGSDFGGINTQSELDILNAQNSNIISFLNSGGGLYAMAETAPPDGLASTGLFGFLPFMVSSVVPLDNPKRVTRLFRCSLSGLPTQILMGISLITFLI